PEKVAMAGGVRHIKDSPGPEGLNLGGQPILVAELRRRGDHRRRMAPLLDRARRARARRWSGGAAQGVPGREEPEHGQAADDEQLVRRQDDVGAVPAPDRRERDESGSGEKERADEAQRGRSGKDENPAQERERERAP